MKLLRQSLRETVSEKQSRGYGRDCLIHIAVGKSCNQVILDCLTRVNRRFFGSETGVFTTSFFILFSIHKGKEIVLFRL